jgi:hypothetical protein
VQVFDQERGDDHPGPVVHEAGLTQLTHPGIDDRIPGLAGFPHFEQTLRVRSGIGWERTEITIPIPPRTVRPVIQHRCVKVAKC